MIVVKVELWSAVTGVKTELARMVVANIGGAHAKGDYEATTYVGRSEEALHKAMLTDRVSKKGKVLGHARLKEHVWVLVAKALKELGYLK